MIKLTEARALDNYCLHLKFSDGVEGEIDLSDLAGQGVFAAWSDPAFFKRVRISATGRSLEWDDEIDSCADALYLSVTGKSVEELFPKLSTEEMRA